MANLKILGLIGISAGLLAPFSVGEFYIENSSFVLTDTYEYLRIGLLIPPIAITYIFFWDLIKRNELKSFNKTLIPFFPKLNPSKTKKNTQIFLVLLVLSLIEIYLVFLLFDKPDFILLFFCFLLPICNWVWVFVKNICFEKT